MIYYISKERRLFSSNIIESSIQDCLDYFENICEIGVDTETEGNDPFTKNILSLQLGDYNNQYVIDTSTVDLSNFKELLEREDKVFIFQNAQFDLRFLYKNNIYPENIYDTLIIETVITGGYGDPKDKKDIREISTDIISKEFVDRKLSLDELTNKYAGIRLNKSIRGNIHKEGLSERVILYGADDVKYLSIIKKKQFDIIEDYKAKYKISGGVVKLENEAVKVFSRMIFNGIKLDSDSYRQKVLNIVDKSINDSIKELDNQIHNDDRFKDYRIYQTALFGDGRSTDINWNSYEQKLAILKKLYPNISSTSSITIRKEIDHPIGEALLKYNKANKLKTAFGEKLLSNINPVTKRVHPSIWQNLATGRISMKEPNLLQIPSKGELGKTIRSCFIPKEGYKMVGGDYSSFELAIIAELSQDPLWLDTLNSGNNLHTVLCSQTFDIPESKVRDPFPFNTDMTYRDVQKTINFGLAYGMSEFKLSNTINVSKIDAKDIIDRFFNKVPKVKQFLDKLGEFGKRNGYIKVLNPYGRLRFFPKWDFIQKYPEDAKDKEFIWLGEIERASKNTPIQGANANVIKIALIKAQKEIDKNNYPVNLLLSIYDEIQSEAREDFAEEWKGILQSKMIEAGKSVVKTVPVNCDVEISDYWKK